MFKPEPLLPRPRLLFAAALICLLSACSQSSDQSAEAPTLNRTVLASSSASVAGEFAVTGLQKISETRVDRTVFEYSFKATVRNNGAASASNVAATLVEAPAGTQIVDGVVRAASIGAASSVTPTDDVIVLRQDRAVPFDPAKLKWSFTSNANIALEPVKPAAIVVLALQDLGLPSTADKVLARGALSKVLLKEGTLRFATPGDTGSDQHASIELQHGSAVTVLQVLIRSQRPSLPLAHVEPNEEGGVTEPGVQLAVGGLGPNNTIGNQPLTFKLVGAAPLDLAEDSVALAIGAGNVQVAIHKFWQYDPASNSFVVPAAAMPQLLGALPNGALELVMNFVSRDGEFAESYDMLAVKQGAKLSGKLQTAQGLPVTSLAGRRILLQGYNNRLHADAVVDANGNFTFEGVIPDTYQLTLDDLEAPNVVSASSVIFAGTTEASVTLTYVPPVSAAAAKQTGAMAAGTAGVGGDFVSSSVTQNGAPPPARQSARTPAAKAAGARAMAAGAGTVFSASAAGQNQTISEQIAFEVPKGSKSVGVKITVSSDEYPVYTTKQSQYNDTWSYSVVGLPGTVLSASGSVNQSHYTQGSITKTECVDVTEQARNAPFKVSGVVSATNIGDSALPTTTTVELELDCVGLKVTAATFSSPNANANPILDPITSKSLPGPYLSIPQSSPPSTHTIPLEIKFSPADATISEVNIGVSANGSNPSFTGDNLLSQPHTASAGKIKFNRLVLPVIAGAMSSGKLVVTVRIKGTVEGTETQSDPEEGGQVSFSGKTAFTPLYRAGAVPALAGRRYGGGEDAGGDSWSTRQTIDFLTGKAYRFNDVSAQHVAQLANGRSVLDHSGHSDGQQMDLRYADGSGGYSEALGGAGNGTHINALINAAAAEVASNAANKPKLATLQAWITANRTMLNAEAAAPATRRIYIGNSFVKRALVDGRFSAAADSAIPGITAWNKPAIVQIEGGHLHHWHLSISAHP